MIAEEHDQRDLAVIQPSTEPGDLRGGSTARPGGLDQVAGHDKTVDPRAAQQAFEILQGLRQGMGRDRVSRGAPGPFVAEVHVGDHGRPLAGVDGARPRE